MKNEISTVSTGNGTDTVQKLEKAYGNGSDFEAKLQKSKSVKGGGAFIFYSTFSS